MYNPDYYKIPPQQGWQCPLCRMIWAPSVVSCSCNKNEVGKKVTTNTIPAEEGWSGTIWPEDGKIDYPEIGFVATLSAVDAKIPPKDEPDCRNCLSGVGIMLASNPPQDGGVYCSVLGKNNPTKDECPGMTKYI